MKISNSIVGVVCGLGLLFPGLVFSACVDDYPVKTVTTIGGGQSGSVNETMTVSFNGHIMTEDGLVNRGRNTVTICADTTVEYMVNSTIGSSRSGYSPPDCADNGVFGTLSIGEKLSCNNKNLGGRDSDTFAVKAGK